MKFVALAFLPCLLFAQQSSTSGPCSPIAPNNSGSVTINCPGLSKQEGDQMLKILNKILGDQLDPEAVMTKLDEIQKGVNEIKQAHAPRRLSEQQKTILRAVLLPFKGEKVTVSVPMGDPEAFHYAQDFVALFREVGFELIAYAGGSNDDGVNPIMIMGGAPPVGLIIQPKDETVWKTPLLRAFDQALTIAQVQHTAQYSGGMAWGGDLEILIASKPIQ